MSRTTSRPRLTCPTLRPASRRSAASAPDRYSRTRYDRPVRCDRHRLRRERRRGREGTDRKGAQGDDAERKSVVTGKSVAVREDSGGRRLIIKKKVVYVSIVGTVITR